MRSTAPAEISINDVKSNDFSLFCCCSSTFPTGVRVTSIRNIKESEATISFRFLIYSNSVVKVSQKKKTTIKLPTYTISVLEKICDWKAFGSVVAKVARLYTNNTTATTITESLKANNRSNRSNTLYLMTSYSTTVKTFRPSV
jgi:hypothetical protein